MLNILQKIHRGFKKYLGKNLVKIFILLGFGVFTLSFSANVFAQTPGSSTPGSTPTTEEKLKESVLNISDLLGQVSKIIYAILWPILFVAGLALDNTLVYGSFLHLDASLRTLRNIMKNFANFGLGFVVLFAIVRNIFSIGSGKSDSKRGPVAIIKKTLIAGVLIQASWFLMAVLIDISTILTYSVGGLPMTVMQTNSDTASKPIMGLSAKLNTKDQQGNGEKMSLTYYHTYGNKKIAPCWVMDEIPNLSGDYIVGRKQVKLDDGTYFDTGYCSLGGWPYKYVENTGYANFYTTNTGYYAAVKNYFQVIESGALQELTGNCYIIPTNKSKLTGSCANYGAIKSNDPFFTSESSNDGVYTLDNLLSKSKGFVGPLVTIYSSLLDFSKLSVDSDGDVSTIANFFDCIIKIFFAVLLFIPLLVLTIVLLGRIGILWIVISALPVLVLIGVFKDTFNIKDGGSGFFKYFQLSEIIKLVFAPVFVVFTIGISMIFLNALDPLISQKTDNSPTNIEASNPFMESLGMQKIDNQDKTQAYSFLWGLIEIDLNMKQVDDSMDTFAWMITKLFAVAIVWFFMFTAIKMTKLGETVGKPMQESFEKLAKNIPIIPLPGGGAVGIEAARRGLDQLKGRIPTQLYNQQSELLKEKYPWLYDGASASRGKEDVLAKLSESTRSGILSEIKAGKSIDNIFTNYESTLTSAGITSAGALATAFNTYAVNNITNITNAEYIQDSIRDQKTQINTFSAQMFDSSTLESMIDSKKSGWYQWAEKSVGSNVVTRNGVKVLVNKGTVTSPKFRFVDIKEYYSTYLGGMDNNMNLDAMQGQLSKNLEEEYKRNNSEPKSSEELEKWKKDKEAWIKEQVTFHAKDLENRVKTIQQSSSSQGNTDSQGNDSSSDDDAGGTGE